MSSLRLALAALSLELRLALRAPGTVQIRLLPALLLVPTLVAVLTAALTLTDTRPLVALPEAGGPDPALVTRALEDEDLRPLFVADPAAALAEGRARAAVLAWETGSGNTFLPWDSSGAARWTAVVQADKQSVEGRLTEALLDVGDALATEAAVLAGDGDVSRGLRMETLKVQEESPLEEFLPASADGRWVLSFAFLGTYGLMFSLPLVGLQDRKTGLAEALAVLPVPGFLLHLARILAWTLVAAVASATMLLEVVVFMEVPAPPPSLAAVLAGGAALLLGAAIMHTVGLACRTPVNAMNLGTGVALGYLAALMGGGHLGLPAWVPVLGLLTRAAPGWQALAAGIAVLLAAGVVALGVRLERRQIEAGT